MDDKGFRFEQRKTSNKANNFNEIEYSKGGGGDGDKFSRFGYVNSTVFSRECHPDPQNPGKIICKETTNRTGYNPFNPNDPQNNFNRISENVYTKDANEKFSFFSIPRNLNFDSASTHANQEPTFWNKIKKSVSGIFGANEDNKENSFNSIPNHNLNNNTKFFNTNQYQNESYERINENFNQIFNEIGKNIGKDILGPLINSNFFNDPFFNEPPLYRSNNYDPNDSYSRNNGNNKDFISTPLGIPGIFGIGVHFNPIFDDFFNNLNNDNNYPGYNGNMPSNQNPRITLNIKTYNQERYPQQPQQNIKYRDNKIYDV